MQRSRTRERLGLAFADMLAATDDFNDWIEADLRLHQAIYLGTRNEFFWPIGRLLEPTLLASFRVTGRAPHHHQQCLPEHRAVHDAILARDPARAHRAGVELMNTTDVNLAQAMGATAGVKSGGPAKAGLRKNFSFRVQSSGGKSSQS